MSLVESQQPRCGKLHRDIRPSCAKNSSMAMWETAAAAATAYYWNYDNHDCNTMFGTHNNDDYVNITRSCRQDGLGYDGRGPDYEPSSKRRKMSTFSRESTGIPYHQQDRYQRDCINRAHLCEPSKYYNANSDPQIACNNSAAVAETRSHGANACALSQKDCINRAYLCEPSKYYNANSDPQIACNNSAAVAETRSHGANACALSSSKRDRSKFEDDEVIFMSRDEIENCSPSRKDGINQIHETYLRYSYCSFLQNVGARLHLPQTTIGTAMVLCHRFFVHRSHASHDRFLIATAVLFLSSKSEETPCTLNDVLKVSCEILHKQDLSLLSYMLPIDWFEKYRERVIDAEQLVLTTLNFELNVQHPYESLTSTLQKLGFAQSVLVNMAMTFISEGLRSSLWLQFKPHQIAAGAAYLAAKFLNMNLASCDSIWHEFHTPPSVLKDVAHQLLELF